MIATAHTDGGEIRGAGGYLNTIRGKAPTDRTGPVVTMTRVERGRKMAGADVSGINRRVRGRRRGRRGRLASAWGAAVAVAVCSARPSHVPYRSSRRP